MPGNRGVSNPLICTLESYASKKSWLGQPRLVLVALLKVHSIVYL